MLWILAIALAVLVIGALGLGLRRAARAHDPVPDAARGFFRDQLEGIDRDVATGRLSEDEAVAARAELAREVIRHEKEGAAARPARKGRALIFAVLPLVALASFGVYGLIGRADLPALPLAGRDLPQDGAATSLATAVAQVEARMVETPNDVRGWLALGPIYMEQGRYGEAANAFRRVLELEDPTPDRQTNLAEALILEAGGAVSPEAVALLESAAGADPLHVRSRFYLASELTRSERFAEAVAAWDELLGIGTGAEAWVETARAGRTAAAAGLTSEGLSASEPDATMDVMIRGMVEGLAARLYDTGGTLDEWTQLVQSRLVLDGPDAARADLARGLDALSGPQRVALEAFGAEIIPLEEQD